jgi:hypothetical protein
LMAIGAATANKGITENISANKLVFIPNISLATLLFLIQYPTGLIILDVDLHSFLTDELF